MNHNSTLNPIHHTQDDSNSSKTHIDNIVVVSFLPWKDGHSFTRWIQHLWPRRGNLG